MNPMKQFAISIQEVYAKALPYLEEGRPGDIEHVHDLINEMVSVKEKLPINFDILVPVAILHDIGHAAVLPEHYWMLTGPRKLANSKLVHMLSGAKIAKKVLAEAKYDVEKSKEIMEIVAMHDADQVEGMGMEMFDTENKKVFHDFDRLEFFNVDRMRKFVKKFGSPDKMQKMKNMIKKELDNMFFEPMTQLAQERYGAIEELFDNAGKEGA